MTKTKTRPEKPAKTTPTETAPAKASAAKTAKAKPVMTDITHGAEFRMIAHNLIDPDPNNPRHICDQTAVEHLANLIAQHGQKKPLLVRLGDTEGRYKITDGHRRYNSINILIERGSANADLLIPCYFRADSDEDALGIALVANEHETMHPVDIYRAIVAMRAAGKSDYAISKTLALSPKAVKQHLALGQLAPALLDEAAADKLNLDCLRAFTLCPDHDKQLEVFNRLSSYQLQPQIIRRALMPQSVDSTDARAQFLGDLSAYEAAGGTVTRDLFSSVSHLNNPDLLDQLVEPKLAEIAEKTRNDEGWAFAEVIHENNIYQRFQRVTAPDHATDPVISDDEEERFNEDAEDDDFGGSKPEETAQEFDAETRARSGVLIMYYRYQAKVEILRGYVPRIQETATDPKASNSATPKPTGLSEALRRSLTQMRSDSLALDLANNPATALVGLAHAMVLKLVYPHNYDVRSALDINLNSHRLSKPEGAPATAFETNFNQLRETLPADPRDLWTHIAGLDQQSQIGLIAVCTAFAIDTTDAIGDPSAYSRRVESAKRIATAVNFDPQTHIQLTADDYFARVSRDQIMKDVGHLLTDDPRSLAKMKKGELAARATAAANRAGWLPALLSYGPSEPATDARQIPDETGEDMAAPHGEPSTDSDPVADPVSAGDGHEITAIAA
jgi:ParB family chromosome partitioning protein